MANVEGRATAITVLSPYKRTGRLLLPVVFWIGRNVTWTLKKLQTLSFIHYARWVIERFPDGGDGERLHYPYLLFESNFNGSWDQYIDAFSEVVPTRMKGIWGTSYGFPGPIPVEPFKDYIRATSTSPTTTTTRTRGRRPPRSSRPRGWPPRSTTCAPAPPRSTRSRSRSRTRTC